MPDDKPVYPNGAEAARLAVGWDIVRASDIRKNDPIHVARVLGQVIQILRRAEAPLPEMAGDVTVHPVTPKDSSTPPGRKLRLTYNFNGGPTTIPLTVFVHFYTEGGDGSPVWGDDHDPPKPTTAWSGGTSYTREITVPGNAPAGTYRIGVGLYDGNGTGDRLELKTAGEAASGGAKRYEVGTVRIT
jgi:hypothetical protein